MVARILFVEDDLQIRNIISLALHDETFEVVGTATGSEAMQVAEDESFDLALVDLRLPDVSGLDVVRSIRKTSSMPIVILTAHGDSRDVVEGLEAGADDFLNKPIAVRELSARLRAILRRVAPLSTSSVEQPLRVGKIEIWTNSQTAATGSAIVALTRTEFGVLYLLAQRSPEIVTRQQLLEEVWGYDYLGDSRLVDMQIYRLRLKLTDLGLAHSLVTVRGVGFRLVV